MKLIYTNEELPQRSDEWLEIRNSTIGASEVAAILGLNPYEDAYKTWQYKTGRIQPKKQTKAMLRGVELESEAMEAAKAKIKHSNIQQFFARHPEYNFASASFDGVDLDKKFIIELKCPSSATNFKAIFTDGIPIYYYPQVQWQLMIAKELWGIETAYFCSYYPLGAYITDFTNFKEEKHSVVVIDFNYNEQYCKDAMEVAKTFQKFVESNHWEQSEYNDKVEAFLDKHYN